MIELKTTIQDSHGAFFSLYKFSLILSAMF